jgi:hypothetical protein
MSTLRDDHDLEQLLRATLERRAGTVDSGPAWTGVPATRRRWLAPLVAAAAVVAVTGAVLGIQHAVDRRGQAPNPRPGTHVPQPSTVSSPPPAPPARLQGVALRWAHSPVPQGYRLEYRTLTADFALQQLVKIGDPQAPPTGGGWHGVLVRVWTPGAFDPASMRSRRTVQVGGLSGLYGSAPAGQFDPQVRVSSGRLPTLAVRHAGRWVTFAGQTAQTQRAAELVRVARSVLVGSGTAAMRVPLRLGTAPAGLRVLGANEDLDPTHPYGLTVLLSGRRPGAGGPTTLDIQVWQSKQVPFSPTSGTISGGGRNGVLDTSKHAVAFPIGRRVVVISLDGPAGSPADLRRLVAGLSWAPDVTDESSWFDATTLLR